MNETDDGTEPLGENPELDPAISSARRIADALSDAAGALAAQELELNEHRAKADALRNLHRRVEITSRKAVCAVCERRGAEAEWPCDTMRIVEAVRL